MDRTNSRAGIRPWNSVRPLALLTILAALISTPGCGWLSLMMYNMNPADTPAEFTGLAEKRVVVVCRPVLDLQFADSAVPHDLTNQVSKKLNGKIKKIELVDEREVAQWTDEHTWQKFTEVGKAMKADIVVGIELERFTLQQGPTLLQGNANLRVVVYDMQKGGRQVHEKKMLQVLFPHTPIPSVEIQEAEFRRKFIGVLAEQIGRQFYPHDSMDDFGTDADLNSQ